MVLLQAWMGVIQADTEAKFVELWLLLIEEFSSQTGISLITFNSIYFLLISMSLVIISYLKRTYVPERW